MYKVIWKDIESDKENDTSFDSVTEMARFVVEIGRCINVEDIRVERTQSK